MCGIAGYSLSSRSSVDRTLAAQSLLAGIAERGADAVGYAYRLPEEAYPVVTKQRTPASELLSRIVIRPLLEVLRDASQSRDDADGCHAGTAAARRPGGQPAR